MLVCFGGVLVRWGKKPPCGGVTALQLPFFRLARYELKQFRLARHGDQVSYYDDDHSAILVEDGQYVSKWGQGPVVLHDPTYAPYNPHYLFYFN